MDAYRVGRLRIDLIWLMTSLAVYVGLEFWLARTVAGQQLQHWFIDQLGALAPRIEQKMLGLAIFGLCSLAHRREQRTASIIGLKRPDGRWVGVPLVIVGASRWPRNLR